MRLYLGTTEVWVVSPNAEIFRTTLDKALALNDTVVHVVMVFTTEAEAAECAKATLRAHGYYKQLLGDPIRECCLEREPHQGDVEAVEAAVAARDAEGWDGIK